MNLEFIHQKQNFINKQTNKTPWSAVLPENLTSLQSVKKFPAFYGTRRFITALTSARHLSLSWTRSIQSITTHPNSLRSILILSFHLLLGLPSGLFPSEIPNKTLCTSVLFPNTCYMFRLYYSPRFDQPNNIWWAVQIIKFLIMWLSPFPCYLVPLRPKYSSQHPILKHHQSTFVPRYKWPIYTPIQNHRQNYSSVYLSL